MSGVRMTAWEASRHSDLVSKSPAELSGVFFADASCAGDKTMSHLGALQQAPQSAGFVAPPGRAGAAGGAGGVQTPACSGR